MPATSTITCCRPLTAQALTDAQADATAALFKALGDPARVKIVNLLATEHDPVCACEFMRPLGLSQPTVSHHLAKLVDVGLVRREQQGTWAYFSLDGGALHTLATVADMKGVGGC